MSLTESLIDPSHPWVEIATTKYYRAWMNKSQGLRVLRSLSRTENEEWWFHVSVSRQSRMPDWNDISLVKRVFLGAETEAYQVMAKESEHVNIHPFCLHLWSPLNEKRRVANLRDLVHEEAI